MYTFAQPEKPVLAKPVTPNPVQLEKDATVNSILTLQRGIGNQAVRRLYGNNSSPGDPSKSGSSPGLSDAAPKCTAGSPGVVMRKPLTDEERAVDLTSERFRDDVRLQAAFDNAPPVSFGERDKDAVRKIQQTLVDLGFYMPVSTKKETEEPDGIFGWETFRTVKAFQHMQGIAKDGIVGRDTLAELEGRLTGTPPTGTSGPVITPPGPSIAVTAVDRSPKRYEPCKGAEFGTFHWEVAWLTNARNGYIVQEMRWAQESEASDGTPGPGVPGADHYWEAWRVQQDGSIHPPPGTDTWALVTAPFHRGTWELKGKVYFADQLDPKAGFKTGNMDAPQAGTLYATGNEPGNLGPVLMTRQAAGRWDNCDGNNVHEPVPPDNKTAAPKKEGALPTSPATIPPERKAAASGGY